MKVPTFNQVAKDWLEYKKPNVRDNTFEMYRGLIGKHFGFINDISINRISVATVERFIADRRENKVNLPTIRKTLITFGQVMKFAVRHRYIDHNPVSEAERPRSTGEEKKPVIRVLKTDEIALFLDSVPDEEYHSLFMVAVMSGIRQGELLGLKWPDIQRDSNQIHIQRTYNHRAWYQPKSRYSNRKVDVGSTVMKRLKRWRLACPAYGLDLVFPNKFGSPIRADYIREHLFEPTWQATGLPDIRFHDLRHTYASLLIAQGEKSNTSKNSLDI